MKRSDDLPAKFTRAERDAYDWLYDCDIRPWVVDMLTKRVTTPNAEYESLVAFKQAVLSDYVLCNGMHIRNSPMCEMAAKAAGGQPMSGDQPDEPDLHAACKERIAELEAERDRLRAENAELRKDRDQFAAWSEEATDEVRNLEEEVANLQVENAELRSLLGKANIALQLAVAWADATLNHWNNDRDSKVGKYLQALAGRLPHYAPDTDGIHAYRREVKEFMDSGRAEGGEK